MNLIKVMLIDDEVLAINYIKNLIPWDKYGFQVVAECTNSFMAFDIFEKVSPDIVIIDIYMPTMDGLEVSSKLLATGRPIKVLLLTSYKDFEYAKEAIKLGISNYLLKHEINADNLIYELEKLKKELLQKWNMDKIIRRQFIKDVLEGKQYLKEDSNYLMLKKLSIHENYVFLLFKRDTKFPLLDNDINASLKDIENLWEKVSLSEKMTLVETFELGDNLLGALIIIEQCVSENETWGQVYSIISAIQDRFKTAYGETISAVASHAFKELKALPDIYNKIKEILKYSIFMDRGKFIYSHEINIVSNIDRLFLKSELESLANSLDDLKLDGLILSIDKLFDNIVKKGYDLEGFKIVCRELVRILSKFRAKNNLNSLDEIYKEGCLDTEKWYTARGIHQWFKEEYERAILSVNNSNINKYSKKVQLIIKYIGENYQEDISISELADKFIISGDHLRHVFKKETNMTILDYITFIRMEKAKKLISSGKYKIYEVAEKVGYKSSQYFSQVFRKQYGVNPLDFLEGREAKYESKDKN